MSGYDPLKLENQLCFPLYVASKEVVRLYHAHLAELGLTYTQYIALMVLWEEKSVSVKALGERLYLDTGTLTPLLKSMEKKGLVTRRRSEKDERSVTVTLTSEGLALRERAEEIPAKVGSCIPLEKEEAAELYLLLGKLIGKLR
ncbi:MAG: MarR family transcriptional regulator [Clostridia bacterium]|nr:MarR family transcriptional regulator [Clostridia bacterium]